VARKALKRRLGRIPSAADLEYARVVKDARRREAQLRRDWVDAELSRPPQQPRAEKAYTGPVLLSPGLAASVVVKRLSDRDQRIVDALQARRARLAREAFDPATDALISGQIAYIQGGL
jgi:hypothetical protein